jgi:hypothetical protein
MTQSELDVEVSVVTGETLDTISDRGFVPLTYGPVEREPLVVDWDELESEPTGFLDELVELC